MSEHEDHGPGQWRLFGLAVFGALLMLCGSLVSAKADPGPALRVGLALAPLAPLGALAWAIVAAVRRMDEMQRKIHLDAMTGAFVATAFVALGYGQLQQARIGLPELNWAFLWSVMVVLWAIAYVVASRRYL
jgi:hypothetical protein